MKEQELLYHYPYRLDKEYNFRIASNRDTFIKRYLPNYDGTNVHEFLYNQSGLTSNQIHDFEYLYENYSNWSSWNEHGSNIFSFSKELLLMLDKTDVSDIKPEVFKLPYDIFYLSLKPLNLKLSKDSEAIIEGVYIDHNIWNPMGEHPDGYCDLSFYFAGEFKESFTKYISSVEGNLQPFTNSEEFDKHPLGSFWNIFLRFEKKHKRETVKEALDHFLKNLKEEILINNKLSEQVSDYDLDFYSETLKLLENTINLVINCLLYLSQSRDKQDIEIKFPVGLPGNFEKQLSFAKTKKEKEKINVRITQSGFSKINYIGHNFRKKYEEIMESSSTIQPHWRRGHWRNQRIGAQLTDSKLIWIMPTIVKSEMGAPLKGHLYDVQKNNE